MTQTMERPPVGAPPPRAPINRGKGAALAPVKWIRKHTLALGIAALLLWLIAGPMAFLINMSFSQGTPARPKGFNLENYQQVYGSSLTYSTLLNTVIYAGTVSLI